MRDLRDRPIGCRDGLPKEKIYDLCLWLLLSSLVGSKLLMLFTEPEYRSNPKLLFSLDFLRSGGVFYGGLIGALLTGFFLMRRWKLPWWKTADACAPGIALGNFFGRKDAFPPDAAGANQRHCRGACSSPKQVTKSPVSYRCASSSNATLRIVCNAHCLFLFAVAAQEKEIQRPGDSRLRGDLCNSSLPDRICARRPTREYFGPHDVNRLSTSQLIGLVVGIGALILLIVRWRRSKATLGVQRTASAERTA
jgi:phosphatidylglycerol:prolipoprotein diacylglycerol transferase